VKLRPARPVQVGAVKLALLALKQAREQLVYADCPKTLERTRLAISSCYGALRHAERRERATQQRRDPK